MGNLFQHRRRTSLIVCIAILLNLLTPALGQAMSSLLRDPLALDICSATPAKRGQDRGQDMPAAGMKHCAFCATHAAPAAPPPSAPVLVALLDGHDAYPSCHYLSPSPPPVWSGAGPRGPPSLS